MYHIYVYIYISVEQEECKSVCVCVGGVIIGVIKRMRDYFCTNTTTNVCVLFSFHETLNPTLFFVEEKSFTAHTLIFIQRRARFK